MKKNDLFAEKCHRYIHVIIISKRFSLLHYHQDDKYYIETEYFSKLGEDVIGTVWFDKRNAESLSEALKKSMDDIRDKYDEYLELYVRERSRGTENFRVRQLVDDADWKVKFWIRFVRTVLEWYYLVENDKK